MPGTVRKNGSWSLETSIGPPHARSTRAAASPGSRRRRPCSARATVGASSKKRASIRPAAADRPGAGAHQHPPVRGRPEVVEEHAPVGDRLAARPADLLEQLRHRLGEDDVAAERRQPAAHRAPAATSTRSWRRRSPARGCGRRPWRPRRGGSTSTRERSCSSTPASSAAPAQRADEPRRLDGRRVGEANAAAEERRDAGLDSAGAPLGDAELGRGPDRARRPPRPAPPSSRPRACRRGAARRPRRAPRPRERALGGAGEDERRVVAEPRAQARERAPVRLEEAAVPAARPEADVLGLEHDDTQRRDRGAGASAPSRGRCSRRRRSRRPPSARPQAAASPDREAPRPATTACGSAPR